MSYSMNWLQRALRGDVSPSVRLTLICIAILLGIVTAYVNARYPLIRLSAIGIVYVIVIEALGGLGWGVFGAVALSVAFSAAEYYAGPADQRQFAFPNAIARLIVFLIAVALVEAIRRQASAINEGQLRRQTLELQRVRAELSEADALFQSVGESIPFGVWHCNADGRVIYMSPSFLQLLGKSLADVREGGWLANVVPEDADRIIAAWKDRHSWQDVWEDEYRIKGSDGKIYTILCRGRCVTDEQGHILGWTGLNLDLTERSRAREQLSFLVEAGRLLSLSLDPSTTLERVANLMVPRIADWCVLETLQDNGELQTVVMLHANPTKLELVRAVRGYPQARDDSRGVYKVLNTGQSELYENVDERLLRETAHDERHLKLLRELRFSSAMIVPLRARGQILGVMTLVHAESGRTFTRDDVRFAEILAARAALAYDNARNYAKEQRVADTFTRASLPTSLPRIPGIRLHATYLPGATESEVGGDWYDAFQLPDGRLAFSIGDVAGKGLRAAVSMASTRPALRGYALEGLTPHQVLERVNQRLTYEGGMVTAIVGVLDPVSLQFTYAGAGHPAPLIGHPDGRVERLTSKGLPLGLFGEQAYEETTAALAPGSMLVLYTDGLIEFDHNILEGERILWEAVAGEMEVQTPDPSAAIVRRVILGAPQDDVAVLTISISTAPLDHVDLVVPSSPASARVIRQALRRFAASIGLDDNQTIDFLTASGEAISNVVEHAYGIDEGPLHVRATREKDELLVQVIDRGRWRKRQKDGSGRGLPLMHALMKKVDVMRNEQGTTVNLRMLVVGSDRDRSGDFSNTGN